MSTRSWSAVFGGMALLCLGCNSNTPEPASADIASAGLRLSIVRMATDPFLQRFTLTMHAKGLGGCSSSTELFPDTGYAGRRNIYQAAHGKVYVWSGNTMRGSSIPRVATHTSRNFDLSIATSSLSEPSIRTRKNTGGIFPPPSGRNCRSKNDNLTL